MMDFLPNVVDFIHDFVFYDFRAITAKNAIKNDFFQTL
jgi:hypothetical protein